MTNLMQTYEDEMFSRDSDVLKKESKIKALADQITNIKRNQNKVLTKSQSGYQERMQQVLLIKEQEIKALKSMLKPGKTLERSSPAKQTGSMLSLSLSNTVRESPMAGKS